jgi:AraC family transcriptional regulator of adaptative response / DNA-3-methyladenine glycosylase II
MAEKPQAPADEWLQLKGIGPWTVDYAKMRGLSNPNIWLGGDLGVKKALSQQDIALNPEDASPWQSYLTFHVWNLL